jgi:hypothetical protein
MSISITGEMQVAPLETVGRQRGSQWGELDRMQVFYTGPLYSLENFPLNAPHIDYPLMFVTGAQEQAIEGALTRIVVTYEGKFTTSGQSSYVSDPVITENTVQGSRDYTLFVAILYTPAQYANVVNAGGPDITLKVAEAVYRVGNQTCTVRFLGNQVSIRYQASPRPTTLNYRTLGLSRVNWQVLSTWRGAMNDMQYSTNPNAPADASTAPSPPAIYAANLGFEREERGKWYNCVEVYGPTF